MLILPKRLVCRQNKCSALCRFVQPALHNILWGKSLMHRNYEALGLERLEDKVLFSRTIVGCIRNNRVVHSARSPPVVVYNVQDASSNRVAHRLLPRYHAFPSTLYPSPSHTAEISSVPHLQEKSMTIISFSNTDQNLTTWEG